MAVEHVQGLEPEVLDQLASKHGPKWEELFVNRWGADWAEPCKQELDSYLGQGWEDQSADAKSEALSVLIVPSGDPEVSYEEPAEPEHDADPEAYPSLDESPWITTLIDVSTFEEWLTRIGVDLTLVESVATPETPSQTESDPKSPDAYPSLDESPWISTILDTATFDEWLVRIGIDAAVVESLAKSSDVN